MTSAGCGHAFVVSSQFHALCLDADTLTGQERLSDLPKEGPFDRPSGRNVQDRSRQGPAGLMECPWHMRRAMLTASPWCSSR